MKVSIIIPVYNDEKFLSEALNSAVNQNFDNYEIICVNDGSTDRTEELLLDFKSKYKNIKVLSQENRGLSAARNFGLAEAKGDYILFMDSDDMLEENTLSTAWNCCMKKELDVLFFSFTNFCNDKELSLRYCDKIKQKKRLTEYTNVLSGQDMFVRQNETKEYYVVVWAQMIKRSFLLKNGINFYDGIIYEDNLYTFDVLMKAKRTFCICDELYQKRIHSDSIVTRKQDYRAVDGYFKTLIAEISIIRKIAVKDYIKGYVIKELERIICQIKKKYSLLSEDEKKDYINSLNDFDYIVFQLLNGEQ